jgi:diacylglycerol kinase (ATP)
MTARILVNPASGRPRHQRRRVELLRALGRRCGIPVEVTARGGDLVACALRAAAEGVERLVVAGGDGSVHLAVQALAGSATALGVVPAGTGNDFATAIGAPFEPEAAVRHALEAPIRRVDLGRARIAGRRGSVAAPAVPPGSPNGAPAAGEPPSGLAGGAAPFPGWVWFSTYAGVGFDSETARRAHQGHRVLSGHAIYVWAVLATLADFRPPRLTVEHDGGRFDGPAMFVTLANGPAFGGGMRIAPAARNDDGVLDLVIVRAIPRRTLLTVFPKVYVGRHVGHPAVEIVPTRRARIALDREMVAYADGEPMLPVGEAGIEAEVAPGALAVCGGASGDRAP